MCRVSHCYNFQTRLSKLKLLEFTLKMKLTWRRNTNNVFTRLSRALHLLQRLKPMLVQHLLCILPCFTAISAMLLKCGFTLLAICAADPYEGSMCHRLFSWVLGSLLVRLTGPYSLRPVHPVWLAQPQRSNLLLKVIITKKH